MPLKVQYDFRMGLVIVEEDGNTESWLVEI